MPSTSAPSAPLRPMQLQATHAAPAAPSLGSTRSARSAPSRAADPARPIRSLLIRGLGTAVLSASLLGLTMTLSSPLRVHLATTLGALLLGPAVLWSRKGGSLHRQAGHLWVGLMLAAALSALFLREHHLPNLFGFSFIHLLCPFVLVQLTLAIRHAAMGRIQAHRKTMQGLYFGACIGAGLFTLLPQRMLGQWLWHQVLGWI